MPFALTDEQSLLKATADRFLGDRRGAASLWPEFAGLGWLALTLPEADGGIGPAPVEVAILAEALGRHRVTDPFVAEVVLAAGLFAEVCPPGESRALLASLGAGTARLAFAHEEHAARGALPHVAVSARLQDGAWTLDGRKVAVPGGDTATHFLITARTANAVDDPAGIALFLLPHDRPGVAVLTHPALDGTTTSTIELAGAAAELLAADAFPAIERAAERALAAWCAEAVGAMEALLAATVEYTKTRVQFGRPLAANQVVRHRVADMAVALEEARSLTLRATHALLAECDRRRLAVAAAKAGTGRASRYVAEQAVQLHGGMGVTEELEIGAFLRRLLALDLMLGSGETHLRRHADLLRVAEEAGSADAASLLVLTDEQRRFQAEVRDFIARHLTDDLRRAQDLTASVYPEPDISQPWQRALFAKGWAAAAWPAEHGGPGWSPVQRYIFELEMSRAGAPMQHPQGLRLVGPVIMKFGTDAQRRYYLPRILSGEDYWCQGYSEPNAGSDLASLKTRAERDGDHYVVNGTKMWTTHAHLANRMFALVRTSQEPKRQDGISFLLIDMSTPGISVRPIMTIGGDHEVNQVFLDNVRVPVANRVGAEGQGWSYGKFLLAFERGGAIVAGRLRRALQRVGRLALEYGVRDDPAIASRLSEIAIDIDAIEMLELRVQTASGDRPESAASSILKLRVSQLHQAVAALGLRVIGTDALLWEKQRPFYRLNHRSPLSDDALPVAARYLDTRAYTIFGGTAEIQHDIIANAVIGR